MGFFSRRGNKFDVLKALVSELRTTAEKHETDPNVLQRLRTNYLRQWLVGFTMITTDTMNARLPGHLI